MGLWQVCPVSPLDGLQGKVLTEHWQGAKQSGVQHGAIMTQGASTLLLDSWSELLERLCASLASLQGSAAAQPSAPFAEPASESVRPPAFRYDKMSLGTTLSCRHSVIVVAACTAAPVLGTQSRIILRSVRYCQLVGTGMWNGNFYNAWEVSLSCPTPWLPAGFLRPQLL